MASDTAGTVYLLHFSVAVADHARHYLGWTRAPAARFRAHRAGQGSPLVRAALALGAEVSVARTWPGTLADEQRMKRWKKIRPSCPLCRAEE